MKDNVDYYYWMQFLFFTAKLFNYTAFSWYIALAPTIVMIVLGIAGLISNAMVK